MTVAPVSPELVRLKAYLPALVSIRFENVATPFTAFTVVELPLVNCPGPKNGVMVTAAVLLETLPNGSSNCTTTGVSALAGRLEAGMLTTLIVVAAAGCTVTLLLVAALRPVPATLSV